MKRKTAALLLGAVLTIGAIGGGTAVHSYATSLDIAGQETETAAETAAAETEAAATETAADGTQSLLDQIAGISDLSTVETTDDESSDFSYSNVADVADAALPSVVAITNKSVQEVRDFFSRQSYQYEAESAGTGIIVGENDTELLICTNNHVVEDTSELTVTFIDDESYNAQLKGTDPSNDLAVVAVKLEDISEDTKAKIKVAAIGDSDTMRIGEQVVAIGNALGYGQSVTTGIISAKDRSIEVSEDGYTASATYEDLIQTDAAINAGNSGGALLNMNGEVIGINSAKASSSGVEGMGYAIPISKAMPILENLMSKVTRTKLAEEEMGYIGINGQGVSTDAISLYGIPAGVYVTYVGPDTPAQAAGLEEGDIITAFDGNTITSMNDLQRLLQYYVAGETVDMTVSSNKDGAYADKTVSITLGDRSELQ